MAMQGDPGTLASEEQASRIQLLDPQQLYQLWEKQHWLSHEIDFDGPRRRILERQRVHEQPIDTEVGVAPGVIGGDCLGHQDVDLQPSESGRAARRRPMPDRTRRGTPSRPRESRPAPSAVSPGDGPATGGRAVASNHDAVEPSELHWPGVGSTASNET